MPVENTSGGTCHVAWAGGFRGPTPSHPACRSPPNAQEDRRVGCFLANHGLPFQGSRLGLSSSG
eukprot:9932765-Alexandrium_andersonii.AAC.1